MRPGEPGGLLELILALLAQGKAQDVVALDLAGKSTLADHMVIASASSARGVTGLAGRVMEGVKKGAGQAVRSEGLGAGDWVLIDAGDVIVHLFRPEVRAFYDLEKMWSAQEASGGGRGRLTGGRVAP